MTKVSVFIRDSTGKFLVIIETSADGAMYARLPGTTTTEGETPPECVKRICSQLGVELMDAPEFIHTMGDDLVYLDGRSRGAVDVSSIHAGWSDFNVGCWHEFCRQNSAAPAPYVEEAIHAYYGSVVRGAS